MFHRIVALLLSAIFLVATASTEVSVTTAATQNDATGRDYSHALYGFARYTNQFYDWLRGEIGVG